MKKLGCLVYILMFVIIIGICFLAYTPSETKEITREDLIKQQFNPWDGSHYNLVETTKKLMNDPKSFEHLETLYRDDKSNIYIIMEFTGKNAFGGTVKNRIEAFADINGKILKYNLKD